MYAIGSCMQNNKHRAIGDHDTNTHNMYATIRVCLYIS
jgi:hypothetical protein